MSGFPSLKPAFTAHLHLAPPSQVGALNSGPSIVHVSFLPGTGQVKSEPSYDVVPPLDAEFLHGADYLRIDPDGAHTRLDVDSLVRDKATGALLRYKYSGTVDMRGGAGKVLRGEDAGSKTPGWGEIFARVFFETGSEQFKELENRVYVAAGRFLLEEGKPVVVEYKVSEVTV